jgi:hypothetical protein
MESKRDASMLGSACCFASFAARAPDALIDAATTSSETQHPSPHAHCATSWQQQQQQQPVGRTRSRSFAVVDELAVVAHCSSILPIPASNAAQTCPIQKQPLRLLLFQICYHQSSPTRQRRAAGARTRVPAAPEA